MNAFSVVGKPLSSLKHWFLARSLPIKIGLIIMLVLFVWFGSTKLRTNKTNQTEYQTAVAEKGTLIVSITASGQISAANSTSITTEASGVVTKVYAQNGASVVSGAPLVEIELDQQAKQKYSAALASYQSANNSLFSAKNNLYTLQSQEFAANQKFMNGAVAGNQPESDPTYIQQNADWLAAEAAYKNQQNVINQVQTSLNSAWMSLQQVSPTIYAPISGVVTGMALAPGTVITSSGNASSTSTTTTGQKIGSIKTGANPMVTINLTEIDVPKVKTGNKATITLDAFPDKTYTGKVISIDTVGTVSSGVTSYPVTIAMDLGVVEIYPNMAASASIITDTKDDVIILPSSAIQTQNGQSSVKILKNGQILEAMVETGLSSDTQVEIVSGVAEGDTVITGTTSTATTTARAGQSQSAFSAFGNRGFGAGTGGNVRIVR